MQWLYHNVLELKLHLSRMRSSKMLNLSQLEIKKIVKKVALFAFFITGNLALQFQAVGSELQCYEVFKNTPYPVRSSTDSWDQVIGDVWYSTVKKIDIPKDGVVVEIGPGGRGKVAYGLQRHGFRGTLYIIEPEISVLEATLKIYKHLLPEATLVGIAKPFQQSVSDIKLRPDAIVANHVIDDAITFEVATPQQRSAVFENCYSGCSLSAAKTLWNSLKNIPFKVSTARQTVVNDFVQFITNTRARSFGLSQYDSTTFRDHGLIEPDQQAQEALLEIGSKLSGEFKVGHLKDAQSVGQNSNQWLLGKLDAVTSRSSIVAENLDQAIKQANELNGRKSDFFYEFDGYRIPRKSAHSKWRAILVLNTNDKIDVEGYLPGAKRNTNVPTWLKSKYANAKGQVEYKFGSGVTATVSARIARALEFSYIDSANPYSPKDSKVVGVHDNLEHIIKVVRQSQAELLGNPSAYIRIDEISMDGLEITSAEKLYQDYYLHNPRYSPKGEWVVDSGIPPQNVLSTYKFKQLSRKVPLAQIKNTLKQGDEVYYQALNGQNFIGRLARDYVVDDFVIVSYTTRHNETRYDISHLSSIRKVEHLDEKVKFQFNGSEVNRQFNNQPKNLRKIIELLSEDPELKIIFASDAGTYDRNSIAVHSENVYNMFVKFLEASPELKQIVTPGGLSVDNFLGKLITVHDIGKSRAAANGGITNQKKYNTPLAAKILSQLEMNDADIKLAKSILDHDDFGRVFNPRTPQNEKISPSELLEILKERAKATGVSAKLLYTLNLIFYLADASSYEMIRDNYFYLDGKNRYVLKDEKFNVLERLASSLK